LAELAGEWRLPPVPPQRKPGSREAKTHLRISTKDLALTIIFAGLYAALVVVFSPISFGVAQFRIAGALRPSIAKKWIIAFAYGLGVFIGNFISPFAGPWDLVFMPIMSIIAGLAGFLAAKRFKQDYFVSGAVTATIIAFSLSFPDLNSGATMNLPVPSELPTFFSPS